MKILISMNNGDYFKFEITELVSNLAGDPYYCACNKSAPHEYADKESSEMSAEKNKEAVNHPKHYQSKTGLEAIDVIEAFDLNFNLGNVIKYILRCGKKDAELQELEKAKWYLEREIANRKQK